MSTITVSITGIREDPIDSDPNADPNSDPNVTTGEVKEGELAVEDDVPQVELADGVDGVEGVLVRIEAGENDSPTFSDIESFSDMIGSIGFS